MSEQKQCCAPLPNGQRCPNNIIDDSSIHCELHFPKGIRLYKLYKKLCDISEIYDLNKKFPTILETIRYINKAYYSYFRAYEGRMEHRIYGLVPECYDYGHNTQFDIILLKIQQSEDLLTSLYDQYFKEKSKLELQKDLQALEGQVDVDEEVKESGEDLEVTEILNKTKDFEARRADDKQKEEIAIEQYIEENKEIIKQKAIPAEEIIRVLKAYMRVNPQYEYYQLISAYKMILRLQTIVQSFSNTRKDQTLIIRDCLSYDDFKRYSNTEEYLKEEPKVNIDYALLVLQRKYWMIKDFIKNAEQFWNSKDINVYRTCAVMIWNTFDRKFLITYMTNNRLKDIAIIKDFEKMETTLGLQGTYFSTQLYDSTIISQEYLETFSLSKLKQIEKRIELLLAEKKKLLTDVNPPKIE